MVCYRPKLQNEFFTSEKCFILEILNHPNCPSVSFARARVQPGIKTQLHQLTATEEYYYITQGKGIMAIQGKQTSVKAGDLIHIPPDTPQSIENTGDEDLLFLCVCLPRFEENSYVNLEQ